ncbi:MAG: hypothetical protein WC901_01230 [Candidatus Margulisiibacteriota bacterium]
MQDTGMANNSGYAGGGGYGAPRYNPTMSKESISQYYRADVAVIAGKPKRIDGDLSSIEKDKPGQFVNLLHQLFKSAGMDS